MGVGGRGPPALPETPGFSGGKGHQGGTEPQAGQGGHQMSCLVCQRPKSHPRGHQGPGEGDPQLLPRNEKRTLGQGGFWGVSGREQEPSTGGDTDNLSCYFVVIWTQVAPVAQSEAGQGVGGVLVFFPIYSWLFCTTTTKRGLSNHDQCLCVASSRLLDREEKK